MKMTDPIVAFQLPYHDQVVSRFNSNKDRSSSISYIDFLEFHNSYLC